MEDKMKENIKSKISLLFLRKKRKYPKYKRQKRKIEDMSFILYDDIAKKSISPLGFTFDISIKHRSIFINEKYRYFKEDDFHKIMKHLKRLVDFYFKKVETRTPQKSKISAKTNRN